MQPKAAQANAERSLVEILWTCRD